MARFLALATAFSMLWVGCVSARDASGDEQTYDPYVEISFLLIRSTPSYAEALQFAEEASENLDIELDLRGLVYDPENGLTQPREVCAKDPLYPYPCYIARGRFDSGRYISIEHSDAYGSIEPGLFVVIAASGKQEEMQPLVEPVRNSVADAYLETQDVYHECMH